MESKKWLTKNKEETLKRALKAFGKNQKQLDRDIQSIKDWMETQHHLPEISNHWQIMNFLLVNKCSLEQTKQKLDMYYTIRHLMPEVYENANINLPAMKKIPQDLYFFPLPKRTEEGYRVSVSKMMNTNPDCFDFYKYMAYGLSTMEVRFQEDIIYQDVLIIDLENIQLGHVFKVSPFQLKKMVTVLEKVYSNKVKQFHFVNCPSFAVNSINLVKGFIKPKLAERIFVHEGIDTLSNVISEKVLPKDYGGLEMSLADLNEMWLEKLGEYKDRFDMLDKLRTDESLRPSALQNDEILGYHGNFRKLEMD